MREIFFIYSIIVCTSFDGMGYSTRYVVQTNGGSSEFDNYEILPDLAKSFLTQHLSNIRDLGYIGELGRIHIIERWKSL